jgi:hypothetical protein
MTDPVDPSPYAQPALTSYPSRIRRRPAIKEVRRLSFWWWLAPAGMAGASILLPTMYINGVGYVATFNGPIAGLAASFAVACLIVSIDSVRRAHIARGDGDVVLAILCYGMGVAAACVGAVCFFNSALMFAVLFR